jgi:hypothetical protein
MASDQYGKIPCDFIFRACKAEHSRSVFTFIDRDDQFTRYENNSSRYVLLRSKRKPDELMVRQVIILLDY